jgi:hypothetical protein
MDTPTIPLRKKNSIDASASNGYSLLDICTRIQSMPAVFQLKIGQEEAVKKCVNSVAVILLIYVPKQGLRPLMLHCQRDKYMYICLMRIQLALSAFLQD